MEPRHIKCIKIVHHPSEVRIYRMLSAFFRFAGIFVCENLTGDEYGDLTDWEYTVKKGSEDQAGPAAAEEPEKILEQKAKEILQVMKEELKEPALDALSPILEVFISEDLMRASYALDYFGDSGKPYIYGQMLKAQKHFENALGILELLEKGREEDAPGNVYIWAAKANCRRRSNEIYTIIDNAVLKGIFGRAFKVGEREKEESLKRDFYKIHFYTYNEINEDIEKILSKDSQFYSAYAIRGFSMEIDHDPGNIVNSVKNLMKAGEIIGRKSYASYLFFRIGRYCERIRPNLIEKMDYYKQAAEFDGHNYRAVYKLAVYQQDQNDYGEAFRLWHSLLDVLRCKEGLGSLQPIECAYLYKTYRNIGRLNFKLGRYAEGIPYLEKAISVYEDQSNEDDEKGFYPWMFGKDPVDGSDMPGWKVYKSAAREKLEIQKTYADIVDVSARASLEDIHSKYAWKVMYAL